MYYTQTVEKWFEWIVIVSFASFVLLRLNSNKVEKTFVWQLKNFENEQKIEMMATEEIDRANIVIGEWSALQWKPITSRRMEIFPLSVHIERIFIS